MPDPLEKKLHWDAEALDFVMQQAHLDRHPPERRDLANRATAAVRALRRYLKNRAERERERHEEERRYGSGEVRADQARDVWATRGRDS